MEKSWNFDIRAKSHGKVLEFDKLFLTAFQNPTNVCVDIEVMEFCYEVMEKSWNFVAKISWQPCY